MILSYKKCKHCGDDFYPRHNDTYCHTCNEAIEATLAEVPIKFEYRFIACDDLTREEAIAEATKPLEKPDDWEEGRIWVPTRRVFPNFFDVEAGKVSRDVGFEYNGINYYLQWWDYKDDYKLKKEVWWDVQNDKECER